MTLTQILFLGLVFLLVFGSVLGGIYFFTPSPTRERLRRLDQKPEAEAGAGGAWMDRLAKVTEPFAKLSVPEEGWANSPARVRFMNAGLRNVSAPAIFFGAKTMLAIVLPIVAYAYLALSGAKIGTQGYMGLLLVVSGLGYYLPNLVLRRLIFLRQREIFETFPDALDLMTVCVEAGLAIDAALMRVAQEMQHKSETLSDELHLVTLELRAGASKEQALRNLSVRTGVEDVDALVAMLIQAERFGTSVADSLRVHSDMLRTKRRQRAEEAAAKIALKLLFPLIFCIFPSMLLVLLGPAFIRIYRILLPIMSGQQ
jgi:tight adherence protein C